MPSAPRSSAPRARFFSANVLRCALCVLAWITALTAVSAAFVPVMIRATAALTAEAASPGARAQVTLGDTDRGAEAATDALPDAVEDDAVDLPAPSARAAGHLGRACASQRHTIAPPGDPDRFVYTRPPAGA